MQTRGSQQNLKAELGKKIKAKPMSEKESWQPKTLAIRRLKQSCRLVNSVADVHVCNNKKLMTDFKENPTKVGGSKSDGISPSRGRVKIKLVLKDDIDRLVLTLTNVFYFPHSPLNVISLGLLNNVGIFYYNKDQTLYN